MGDKRGTSNLTTWPEFGGGNSGGNNDTIIGCGGSIMLNILMEHKNFTIPEYTVEAEAVGDDGQSVLTIILASILMVVSIFGNAGLFVVTTWRMFWKKTKIAIHLFVWSLAIADILLSTMLLPLQVGLIRTNPWKGREAAWRAMEFFRLFSYYLYGFIITCMSVDQYMLVYRPFLIQDSVCRAMVMLSVALVASICCGLPEAVLDHVCSSPHEPQFMGCTSTSPDPYVSAATYFLHAMIKVTLDLFPFVVVVICYFRILRTMRKTQRDGIRGSWRNDLLGWKEKRRLQLLIAIGLAFLLCRLPSTVITLWSWIHPESALRMNPGVWTAIILISHIGPCVNPFLYGFLN